MLYQTPAQPSPENPEASGARRLAVIGAGPLGLEAAHCALRCGLSVRVFDTAAEAAARIDAVEGLTMLARWSELRTPGGLRAAASAGADDRPPAGGVYPTGRDYLRCYLAPLAAALPPKTLWLNHRVVGVTRAYLQPEEMAQRLEARVRHPFRLLTRNPQTGEERAWSAEYVLDCTGNSAPGWMGGGGLPAIGEMGCSHQIFRTVPDIAGRDRGRFAGAKTLLLGDGRRQVAAALSASLLGELAETHDDTQIYWASPARDGSGGGGGGSDADADLPCGEVDPSQLATSRVDLIRSKANLMVRAQKPYLIYSRRTQVEEIRYNIDAKKFFVTLQVDRVTKRYRFDNIVVNVAPRREPSYLRRLAPGELGFYEIGAPPASSRELPGEGIAAGYAQIGAALREIGFACDDGDDPSKRFAEDGALAA